MTEPSAPRSTLHWATAFVATVIGYALLGRLALLLAIPPGFASPIYPAAGLGLAMVLGFGRRMVPAVVLGSIIVNLWNSPPTANWLPWVLPLAVGLGAGLQSAVAAALVRRLVRQPLTLAEPRDILRFYFAGAFAACTVGASIGVGALAAGGVLHRAELPVTWLTWWVGDTLGTLITAPIVLTWIGKPRADWAPRRRTIGLTLGFVTVLLAAMISQVMRWEDQRARGTFDRDAENAATVLSFKLQESLHALEALHGAFIASEKVDRREMALASGAWLGPNTTLRALGHAQRVLRAELPAFEAAAQQDGLAGYRVMDRVANDPSPQKRSPFTGDEAMAIRLIEPPHGNAGALGINLLSVPEARTALGRAVATGEPAATAAFRLSQEGAQAPELGVVIYRALYAQPTSALADRPTRLEGAVFATLQLDHVLNQVRAQVPPYLHLCLFDADPAARQVLLTGGARCEAAPTGFVHQRPMPFAGRQWAVRIDALAADLPAARQSNAWLFAVVGLLAVAVLGALLLTVTGRTRRIEAAVSERTAALQLQVQEREQAEAALRESEQRFRNIFNTVPLGLFYTDLDGEVKQTNPHFCELVGYGAKALLSMNARDFTHPEDIGRDREAVRQLVAGDIAIDRRQKRFLTRGGAVVWVQSTLSLLRDERGMPQRIVSAAEDITENLRLADADRARRAAEASNRAKSEFLSRMSHELRTPLNAMLGFAQLLELDRRHPLADAQKPWVAQIQQAGWHLLEMINDVLDLSRIESGNLRLSLEPVDVREMLDATLPLLDRDAQRRSIVISEDLQPGALLVLADPTRTRQILTNLLSNAIKYNIDGGRVHIASQRAGERIDITVTDTGMGMTAVQMDELFQPFNRLGRERTDLQGTGIGLVISQRLAELMGGELTARSASGEGSSFILSLPFVEAPDTIRSPLGEPELGMPQYHRRHVHYVEDNETNVEVMRGILAQRPQVKLDVSLTGLDGLVAIRQKQPDVVLLDMHLPDINGMELLRRLQADPATADIPVVVVSADALESQIVEAVSLGAYRYLTKPVNVGELLAVLDGLLSAATTRFG